MFCCGGLVVAKDGAGTRRGRRFASRCGRGASMKGCRSASDKRVEQIALPSFFKGGTAMVNAGESSRL
ncbi:hypothetical protein [Lysobacter gummosus]|uniref:hypothetical protein n=1 Tax=Lysobacter gummosus TaxID=262324 RepID=UPI00363C296E